MPETKIILDLENYKDRIGGRVPPGRYAVVVEDVELDKSKAGNPMVNVWFNVIEGEGKGVTLADRLVLTEKSLFRIVGFMQALGLPTPKKRFSLDIRKFVGQQLLVDVDDGEPYNGRVKSEVKGYIRLKKAVESDTSADVEDLDALDTDAAAEEASQPPRGSVDDLSTAQEPEVVSLDELDL